MAVGGILSLGLAREIAPLLTATLLTGKKKKKQKKKKKWWPPPMRPRLGTMKVTEQTIAIRCCARIRLSYLVGAGGLLALVIMGAGAIACSFLRRGVRRGS